MDHVENMFRNRSEAGRRLAEMLSEFSGKRCTIYALPRGGLPVAYEVAARTSLPLDVLLVKKLGAPFQEELALGAITEGDPPTLYLNHSLMYSAGVDESSLQPLIREKLNEISSLKDYYREGREISLDPSETAIIVDDGIATGATVKAAVNFFRDHDYRNIVVAVPVAHNQVLDEIRRMTDEIYCCDPVNYMYAVGEFYSDFRQISHEEAREILLSARLNAEKA